MFMTHAKWTNRTNRMNQQSVFVGFLLDQQNFSVGILLDQYTTFAYWNQEICWFCWSNILFYWTNSNINYLLVFYWTNKKVPVGFLLDQNCFCWIPIGPTENFYWISNGPTGIICWILWTNRTFLLVFYWNQYTTFPIETNRSVGFYWSNILLDFRPG